jgi:hypothetical protein
VSDKFVIPTQKGTELFPQQTRIPASKLRVTVNGLLVDPAFADRVGRAFANEVNNFYLSQVQNYSLSTSQQLKVFSVVGRGVRLTYNNVLGAEYLNLDLDAAAARQFVPQPQRLTLPEQSNAFIAVVNANAVEDDVFNVYLDDQYIGTVDFTFDVMWADVWVWDTIGARRTQYQLTLPSTPEMRSEASAFYDAINAAGQSFAAAAQVPTAGLLASVLSVFFALLARNLFSPLQADDFRDPILDGPILERIRAGPDVTERVTNFLTAYYNRRTGGRPTPADPQRRSFLWEGSRFRVRRVSVITTRPPERGEVRVLSTETIASAGFLGAPSYGEVLYGRIGEYVRFAGNFTGDNTFTMGF